MGDAKRQEDVRKDLDEQIKKWKVENPTLELKMIFLSNNALIGELVEDEKGMVLKRPRGAAVVHNPQGQTVIMLQQLIGSPKEIRIYNPSAIYEVQEEEIINLYIQAVTGIIPGRVSDLDSRRRN